MSQTHKISVSLKQTHTYTFSLVQGELVHLVKGQGRVVQVRLKPGMSFFLEGRIELLISQQIALWGIHVSEADLPDSTKLVAVWNSVREGLKELCTLNQDYFQWVRLHLDKSGQTESISLLVDEYRQLAMSSCPQYAKLYSSVKGFVIWTWRKSNSQVSQPISKYVCICVCLCVRREVWPLSPDRWSGLSISHSSLRCNHSWIDWKSVEVYF